jgi:hypothetical protein
MDWKLILSLAGLLVLMQGGWLRHFPPGLIAGLALAGISPAVCLGLLIRRRTS